MVKSTTRTPVFILYIENGLAREYARMNNAQLTWMLI